MAEYTVRRALDIKAELGESPAWSVDEQALYWIDIYKRTVNRFDPASGENTVWSTPTSPGCLVFREGGGAIVPCRDGIYDLDFATGALRRLMAQPYNAELYRFNDGKNDRQGRLWVGSMPVDSKDPILHGTGTLYRYDGRALSPRITPITSANGTAFSPDGRTLYRAETRQRRILAYDYDPETGLPSNERLFASVPPTLGLPDGATVDAAGGYWAALPAGPDGGGVARFAPDGSLDVYFRTPVVAPTMVTFGGADLTTLYVTSARLEHEMSLEPNELSGALFSVETPFLGLPEAKLKPPAA